MKLLSIAALATLMGSAVATLANGAPCKSDGSMGVCASGFCLAQGNQVGKCQAQ
ncbi:hypothetical protein BDV59DRAFT_202240 [Aspergillus ambiguus]|uniref:uncharacterized protein n=1 Tax=Aspergillus ambiguus TaxID=176160 RepID=UPI003CCCC60B